MNTLYILETLATKAIIDFNETTSDGIQRKVIPVQGGFKIEPPLPAYDEPFLVGEKIPDEVRNKPKKPNLQTVPTISFSEMMKTTYAANWLIDGLIEQTDLGLIFGASGSGKTFVALDMAYCIAAGIPYHGRNTKKTGVLYVCGEGHNGLQKRLKAIHYEKGNNDDSLQIHTTKIPAAFIDRNSTITVQNTINQIGNIGLVLVDTLHRNLGDADENSAQAIAKFLQNIDLYLRSSGIAVVVVHHSGNEANGRSRGSSSIRAAMDVEYEVKKDADSEVLTVSNTKMKNFEQPKPFSFKFKPVAESVVLESTDFIPKKNKTKLLNDNSLIALNCLSKLIATDGIAPPQIIIDLFPDSPQNIPDKVINLELWRKAVYDAIPVVSEPDKKQAAVRSAFNRAKKDLIEVATIGLYSSYIWKTKDIASNERDKNA